MRKVLRKNTTSDTLLTEAVSSRRLFFTLAGAFGTGILVNSLSENTLMAQETPDFSFGVVTDLHYADKTPAGSRNYRDSYAKLETGIDTFNALNTSFIVELGDIIDKAEKDTEIGYLKTINSVFTSFNGPCHYVIGNHCVATFSKDEFLALTGSKAAYYSFDAGRYHFVVLDANFNKDGSDYNGGNFVWTETYIPEKEMMWLKRDFSASRKKKAFIFIHQNLHDESDPHGVKNAPQVRAILEQAGNVEAVFQGHDHRGGFARINKIPYITLRAAVEGMGLDNRAFAMVHFFNEGHIHLNGYGAQRDIDA